MQFLFAVIALILFPSQQGAACTISDNQLETIIEARGFIVRNVIYIETDALTESDTYGVMYVSTSSLRRHLESIHEELPACAQPLNDGLIDTLVAVQDVLALEVMQRELDGGPGNARVTDSREHLAEVFSDFSDLNETITLQSE
jgi:hypothetical protein